MEQTQLTTRLSVHRYGYYKEKKATREKEARRTVSRLATLSDVKERTVISDDDDEREYKPSHQTTFPSLSFRRRFAPYSIPISQ